MLAHFDAAGATFSAQAADAEEADALFAARRLAYPALERLGPVLTEDVCVPRAAVPEMLARIQATGERFDTTIANLAHAGDGNLHPLLITPIGDEPARERAQAAFEQILDRRPGARRHRHRRARRRPAQARRARRASSPPRPSPCSARSRPPSTRTASSTRARSSDRLRPRRQAFAGVPGASSGADIHGSTSENAVDANCHECRPGWVSTVQAIARVCAWAQSARASGSSWPVAPPPPRPPIPGFAASARRRTRPAAAGPAAAAPRPTPGTRPPVMPAAEPAAGVGAVVEPARRVGVGGVTRRAPSPGRTPPTPRRSRRRAGRWSAASSRPPGRRRPRCRRTSR